MRDDYETATVRLLTVEADRASHLLFGCVELLPLEIPCPTPIAPERLRAGKKRLTHRLDVVPAPEALAAR
jgi:hypothetical protein